MRENSKKSREDAATLPDTAGWSIDTWARSVPMGTSTYFTLPEKLRPRHTKIGRKTIIFEPPRDWLERIAKAGGIPGRAA